MCMFEPINGSYPTDEFCEEINDCRQCSFWYEEEKSNDLR